MTDAKLLQKRHLQAIAEIVASLPMSNSLSSADVAAHFCHELPKFCDGFKASRFLMAYNKSRAEGQ